MLFTIGVGQMWADKTVYLINTSSWDKPTCHHWKDGGSYTTWPGDDMTKTDIKYGSYFVWKCTISDDTHDKCIFSNNGANQTGNLSIPSSAENRYYNYNSGWIYLYTFSEEAVLYFKMSSWWTNTGDPACYQTITLKKNDGNNTSRIPVYKLQPYLDNNEAALSNTTSGENNLEMFATVPAGSYWSFDGYRGSSNSTKWNTFTTTQMSTSKNKDNTAISEQGTHTPSWTEYKPTSSGSVTASSSSVSLNTAVTMTPSLTSNTLLNNLKSTVYGVSPGTSGTDWTMVGNVFTPLKAGTYTITATITYNAKGFPDLTTTVTPTTTVTAYATITLDKNGGTANGSAVFEKNATSATSITHATNTAASIKELEGYYDVDGTTKVLNADGSFAATNVTGYITDGKWTKTTNCTLYAHWTAYTINNISVSPATGSTGTKSMTVSFKTDFPRSFNYRISVFGSADSGTKGDGYYLNGQGVDSGDENTLITTSSFNATFGSTGVYTAEIEIYTATATIIQHSFTYAAGNYYTVSFDMQGHGSAVSSQNVASGGKATEPDPEPTATGYTFGGWYKEEACTNAWNFSTETVTANKTLFAKWTANKYDVILDANGGAESDQTVRATFGSGMPLELKAGGAIVAPTKTGYTFGGYYANNNSTGTQYYTSALASNHNWDVATDNIHIYAGWTPRSYGITYVDANNVATITSNPSTGNTDATIEFTVTLKRGYKALSVTAKDAGDNTVTVTNPSSNTYRFTMPANAVTVTVTATALPVVYVMKSKDANCSVPHGFTSAGGDASKLKLWAWNPSDSDRNFYTSDSWPGRAAADEDTYTDAFGNVWYRFVPNNTSYFNNSSTYKIILTYNGENNRIYNSESNHWYCSDGVNKTNCNSSTNYQYTGSVWIIPQGSSAETAILYTSNPAGLSWSLYSNGSKVEDFAVTGENVYSLKVAMSDISNLGAVCFKQGSTNYKLGDCALHTSYTSAGTAATLIQNDGNFSWNGSPTGTWVLTIFKESSDWKVYATPTYTVTYYGNTNTGGSVPVDGSSPYTSGADVTVLGNTGSLVKTGYAFDCWNTRADGTGTDYAPGATISGISANVTLYAKWYEQVNSGWYMIGQSPIFDDTWNTSNTKYPLDRVYPGQANTYYRKVTFTGSGNGFRLHNGSSQKSERTSDNTNIVKGTQYSLVDCDYKCMYAPGAGTYWCVYDKTNAKFWIQDPDLTTYYSVTFGHGTGGSSVSAVDGESASLTSGVTYAEGTAITFSQTNATGYTFSEWNTADDGSGSRLGTGSTYTIASLAADVSVYAIYTEDMHDVTVSAGVGGSCNVSEVSAGIVTVSSTITATPSSGYYFTGWTIPDGVTIATGSTTTASITINATADSKTVTANFHADDKIYFDNTYTQWDHVWVYLFSNNSWWNDGEQGVHPGANIVAYAEMTLVSGEENLYEFAYHNSEHNYSFSHVAFCKADQHGNTAFYATEAAYRGDWNATMPIYVAPSAYTTTNDVKYHSGGYWMMKETTAGESVGYALRHKTGESTSAEDGKFIATADGSHVATITLRYDDTSDKTYFINNLSSQNYSLNHTFTSVDNGTAYSIYHYDDIVQFTVKPTSVGLYTFTLEQGPEYMQLSVQYPVQIGDYRVVYSRSIRKKDDSADSTAYRYSDVIRNGTATAMTSMYINNSDKDKGLKLQTCTGFDASKNPIWGDVAGSTGLISYFAGKDAGVYQFNVNIDATTPSYTISDIAEYSGSYYIKTDCAPGGWANYTQNVMDKNTIKYDGTDATYDYYMCKWIGGTTTNVKCVIANEYNNAISDTLVSDAILTRNNIAYETLPYAANVRFSYNSATNTLKRTYLLGSADANSFLYIVAEQDDYVYKTDGTTDLHDETESNRKFTDAGNWTYQMEVKAYPGATGGVRTKYPTVAPITEQILIPDDNILIDGDEKGSTLYDIRLVYDFKTNYLMAAWVASTPAASITLDADMLIIRKLQEAASQVTLGAKTISEVHTIYGAIQFDYDDMVGNLGSWAGNYGKLMYDISFPFDVNVSDIFGAGDINDHWIIQKYDGAERASIGWFAETNTFWKTLTTADKMNAYEGYTLIIDRPSFNSSSSSIWINKTSGSSVYLYFPSASDADKTISSGTASIVVPEHKCTIDRSWTPAGGGGELNHQNTDSHWNMIGTPLFENAAAATVVSSTDASAKSLNYYYEWNPANNTYNVASAAAISTTNPSAFKAMHGYMVQWAGTITFSGSHISSSVAARRLPSNENYQLELRMANVNGDYSRAFVELCENACDTFALNEDMYMMRSSKMADLYTYAGNYDVSANVLSVNNHIVPVGMDVKVAGLYTFSMPSEFSGSVVLIDTYTGARTNLALGDYEVNLTKGTLNDRFFLEINIHNAPTAIEGIEGGSLKDGKAHKFVQNGVMYILRDGKIYDARGAKIK